MTLLLVLALASTAPDTLRLAAAQEHAIENFPLRRQLSLQESIADLHTRNHAVSYLPALSIRAQAVYYSDVAEIGIPAASEQILQPSQDQYKLALRVDQLLYDGGVTAHIKMIQGIQRDLEKGKIEVELYKLKEQVSVAYFGALIFAAQIESIELLHSDLTARLRQVESLVSNGALLRSDADVLAAELITVEQQRIEAQSNRDAAINVLSELVGRPVSSRTVLVLPEVVVGRGSRERPEYGTFQSRRKLLAGRSQVIARGRQPKLTAFAETAYGRPPGLDFLETGFKPFFSAGLRLSWSPWTWNKTRRDRQILRLEKELVDAEEQSFRRQIQIAVHQDQSEISKYGKLLERDAAIVAIREDIARQAASQLANGVITSSDYLIELNAASRAALAQRIHQIQLAQAKVNYLTTIGN